MERSIHIPQIRFNLNCEHDDVIKWKHVPRYWPFVWGIHRSPVNSPHKGQWRWALMFSLIWAWTNGWVNNRDAGDLRRNRAHYDVTSMNNGNKNCYSDICEISRIWITSITCFHANSVKYILHAQSIIWAPPEYLTYSMRFIIQHNHVTLHFEKKTFWSLYLNILQLVTVQHKQRFKRFWLVN